MPRAATTPDAFNAVAEPRRREILSYLVLQERVVGDIVASLGLQQPSVSKHLPVLREVGLVRVRRDGRQTLYRTNAGAIKPLHAQFLCERVNVMRHFGLSVASWRRRGLTGSAQIRGHDGVIARKFGDQRAPHMAGLGVTVVKDDWITVTHG